MIDELLTEDTVIDNDARDNIKNEDISMDSIHLSDECTIYEITQIHQKIHDKWQTNTNLNIDVSAVTEVDASFMQLLASCKKMAMDNNQFFKLINPSEKVTNKMKAMFMSDYFNSQEIAEK
ncbi:MAG: STAS domain-containing protein [gamma proteobacterium symbiont of Bathyaustriella thionipta]|nr:STAS domain-containing protein [gamma proteobacterium symbiont of Bathyaustriella thionipta]MCU7954394.1 STAS domain-containing protein [gamma proteobacterium symbiont of Bathyaustriella thionipta]